MKLTEAKKMIKQLMKKNCVFGWRAYLAPNEIDAGATFYAQHVMEFYNPFFANNKKKVCQDTVLHEIAHALLSIECEHGEDWKKKCIEIGAIPEEFLSTKNFSKMVMPREMTNEELMFDTRFFPVLPRDKSEIIYKTVI